MGPEAMHEARRRAFGGVAELYDRRRPSYPERLVDDLIALASADGAPIRALEVGAGTGKATVLFAARCARIDAIEPSAEMAALGAHNLSAYAAVTFTRTEFEAYAPPPERFDLLYSAQAWHWIDPARRYQLARAALRPGGVLAAFWNRAVWDDAPLRHQFDDAYRRHAPELAQDSPVRPPSTSISSWTAWPGEIEASAGFGEAEIRAYDWELEYTSREYAELLRTHSDHALLAPERRAALLGEIERAIDAQGGSFTLRYVTRLCTARAI